MMTLTEFCKQPGATLQAYWDMVDSFIGPHLPSAADREHWEERADRIVLTSCGAWWARPVAQTLRQVEGSVTESDWDAINTARNGAEVSDAQRRATKRLIEQLRAHFGAGWEQR